MNDGLLGVSDGDNAAVSARHDHITVGWLGFLLGLVGCAHQGQPSAQELLERIGALEKQVAIHGQRLSGLAHKTSVLSAQQTGGDPRMSTLPVVSVHPEGSERVGKVAAGSEGFSDALNLLQTGRIDQACHRLKGMTDDSMTPTAEIYFWLGECLFTKKDYPGSIEAFRQMVHKDRRHDKVPDALWRSGLAQERLGRIEQANKTFSLLVRDHPRSSVVELAKAKLGGHR